VIPQPGMLEPHQLHYIMEKMENARLFKLSEVGTKKEIDNLMKDYKKKIQDKAREIWADLRPHPAGQKEENVPRSSGLPVDGMQHKYRETVLFFPAEVCPSFPDSKCGY